MSQSSFWSEERPANPSPSPASEAAWRTSVVIWRSSFFAWLNAFGPAGWYGRTSPVSCHPLPTTLPIRVSRRIIWTKGPNGWERTSTTLTKAMRSPASWPDFQRAVAIPFDTTQITIKANGGGQVTVAFQDRHRGDDGRGYDRPPPVSVEQVGTLETVKPWNVALPSMAVRRLTPRECERLQGFPDDYTLVSYRGKPASDGPRYKALGNSMAIPVVRWIGERIQMVENLEVAVGAVA